MEKLKVGKSRKWKKDPAHLDTAPTRIQEQSDPIQKPTGKEAGDLDGEEASQAIVERTHQSLKKIIEHQQAAMKVESPHVQLAQTLFTYNFLNCAFENLNPPIVRHFKTNPQLELKERPPVLIEDPEMWQLQGPFELVM
ncbi:hypothetical protein DV515_00015840 [Chloebia gouldiae]|uniref:Uncharacterized protein n=1 Tax=Chloebia gouldiae TaxID=44316 RepID=A0A3L8RU61_CHLGU|nr:hypothetical protein DV515_00015840 [Chloebia gouldiae]